MPALSSNQKYNPNPITKFVATILLGLTVVNPLKDLFAWGVVIFLSILFLIVKEEKDAIKNIVIYLFLWRFPSLADLNSFPAIIKIIFSIFFIIRIFYLPFLAGKYFIKTSDVGSIITSMDKLKIPSAFSIPIAVMFRFFPSFKEERKNIKLAMKIRGITPKNPIAYIEYVMVPLLVLSSNIADDIAKAAETKCIADPGEKVRYKKVRFGLVDCIFSLIMGFLLIGGWIC